MRRLAGVLLAVSLLAAGCGGKDKKESSDAAESTTTSSTTSTTAGGGAGGAAGTAATSTTVPSGPNASGSGKNATAPAGSAPAGSAGGGGGGSASSDSARPATPGTYTYNRTGKASATGFGEQSLDGPVSLKVDPIANGEQRSLESSSEGEVEQVLRLLPEGAYFTLIRQSTTGFNKEFRPNPPVLAVPTAPAVGRTWSWTVTSTDGKTTINASFKVDRKENLTIGGEQVSTVVLVVNLKASGDITLNSTQTNWVALSKGLSVRIDEVADGTISGVPVHSESSQTLQSTRPS